MDVTLSASPRELVTVGSTLSMTLTLANPSWESAHGVTAGVPVPYGTSYVEGTLLRDAARSNEFAFFGEGCEIGELSAGARTLFAWKLRVHDGDEPIRIVPQVFAGVTRIFGAEPIVVTRSPEPLDPAQAYRVFESAARAYFTKLFTRPAPPSLQQILSACALACGIEAEHPDPALEAQARTLHRLANAVRGHHVTGVDSKFLMNLRGLRDAHAVAATKEGLRAFAALDVAARNLAADDRVRDAISLA